MRNFLTFFSLMEHTMLMDKGCHCIALSQKMGLDTVFYATTTEEDALHLQKILQSFK